MMEDQMKFAFMQQGGVLRDDGMNKDPVSGNEVPSGSMAKEVRDDIDAKLSEGEYVVPADVVRFHGVQKFEDLRNQAKKGFGRMEQDGRIGGEPVDDNFPIPVNQLQTFDQGGDTNTYEQTFGQPFQMGQRYGDMGAATNLGYELITYTSPDGQRTIVIPHFNGKPMSAIPTGFAPQGTQTTGGGGVGMSDSSADERDRQERENEAVQRRNMGQPVTIDPLMQAQLDKDAELTKPKAPEDFSPQDFIKYKQESESFGVDDIVKGIPLIGGLLTMEDARIKNQAQKMLLDKQQQLTQDEFNDIKGLVMQPKQTSFLGNLFGVEFTPNKLIDTLTYADYNKGDVVREPLRAPSFIGDVQGEVSAPVPDTVKTAEDLGKVDANKVLSTGEIDNVIKDLSQDKPLQGSVSNTLTKAMMGITDQKDDDGDQVINTPSGMQKATASKIKGIVDNAQNIQTTLVGGKDPYTGEDKKSIYEDPQSYGIDKPMGAGPPSVTEIYNAIHGMDIFNKGGIVANKGVLVTKPKRKVAPKKRTTKKGLGNKTKAT